MSKLRKKEEEKTFKKPCNGVPDVKIAKELRKLKKPLTNQDILPQIEKS